MRPFDSLDRRGQVVRLRRLAETALARYEVEVTRSALLAHAENTTFRIRARDGERYVLRVHRVTGTPWHPTRSEAAVESDLQWLSALRRDTALVVPEPVRTRDGALLAVAAAEGVPEPRICVLFRWVEGRFLDAGLTPAHLARVGGFAARLHEHAAAFAPPAGFVRGRVDDVSAARSAFAIDTVAELLGRDAAAIVEAVIAKVDAAQRALGRTLETFGPNHADLHQENHLFHRGTVCAIDFDDCGWGHHLYDLAVTLSEVQHLPDREALRAELLRGYRSLRPLPPEHERYLETFQALRRLLLTLWFLEQRDHPAFPDWEADARGELEELAAFVRA